jgi:uncharacterized membrane protein
MNETTREVEIDAPAAAVWAILEDVRRMPELSPSTVEVDAPPALRAVGDRFEQVVRLGGKRFRSEWEVTSIDPGRRLAIAGSVLPGTRYEMDEVVSPTGADGARTTLRLTMRWKLPFGPVGRLAGRLGAERRAVDEAEHVLDGVRRLAEASAGART